MFRTTGAADRAVASEAYDYANSPSEARNETGRLSANASCTNCAMLTGLMRTIVDHVLVGMPNEFRGNGNKRGHMSKSNFRLAGLSLVLSFVLMAGCTNGAALFVSWDNFLAGWMVPAGQT